MSVLTFDIVSSEGVRLHEERLDKVVFRRREADHDPGSEVVILPRHAPLLMQTQAATVRFTRGGSVQEVAVAPGVVEVYRNRVTLAET